MELLTEIWEVEKPQEKSPPAYIYVLNDGKQYSERPLNTSKVKLSDKKIIFKI